MVEEFCAFAQQSRVAFCRVHLLELCEYGQENGSLALGSRSVAVYIAQTGIFQSLVAVEMICSGAVYYGAVLTKYRSKSFYLRLRQRDIHSAERINGLDKAVEVYAHIVVDSYLVVLLYSVNEQLRSAVGVRRVESGVAVAGN